MSLFKIEIKPKKGAFAGTTKKGAFAGKTLAVFDPNPQTVFVNDNVFWFNSDPKHAHWPAPSASAPKGFMKNQIAPNSSSDQVGFPLAQTIPYICFNHQDETGKIIVKPVKSKKGAYGRKTKKGAFARKTKSGTSS